MIGKIETFGYFSHANNGVVKQVECCFV